MKKLAYILLISPLFSQAGLFRFSSFAGAGADVQAAIEAEVNKNLPSADTEKEYFQGMSTANAMSAAGVTTSYGTVFNKFLVGVTASGGAHLGSKSFTDFSDLGKNPEQLRGFGAQAALVAGINVGGLFGFEEGFIDPNKLRLYLSGFALDKKFGDVNAKYFGAGISAQYRLMDEKSLGANAVKWTGLDLGAGLLYSTLEMDATLNLNKSYTSEVSGQTVVATLSNTSALLSADVSTFSIPLEVSTGLRLFYFFKLIAGAGVDLNFGKTKGSGSLAPGAAMTATVNGAPGVSGTPEFTLDGSEGPDFANLRVFAGPHFEFGVGSVFVNVHKSLLENAVAVNTGLNFFW